MKSYWRAYCAPIIARVLLETQGKDEKEIRKALKEAYPFGPREMHPYRIWLDEIDRQRHPNRKRSRIFKSSKKNKKPNLPDPKQAKLF